MAFYLQLPPGSEGTSVPAGQPMEPTGASANRANRKAKGERREEDESTAEAWLPRAWAI